MSYRLHRSPFLLLSACYEVGLGWARRTGWKILTGSVVAAIVAPDATYWFAAGVMSSVGLGTGFHTGPLLLFPHVSHVAAEADDFQSAFVNCLAPVLLWGIGTAVGELPPFYAGPQITASVPRIKALVERAKGSIERYGMGAIFLLACYPNLTFDAAGMAAGAIGMPTYEFLTATICGKAFVKAPAQSAFIIASTRGLLSVGVTGGQGMGYLGAIWGGLTLALLLVAMWLLIERVGNEAIRSSSMRVHKDTLSASHRAPWATEATEATGVQVRRRSGNRQSSKSPSVLPSLSTGSRSSRRLPTLYPSYSG